LLSHLLHVLASEVTSAVMQQGQLLQTLQAVCVLGCTCSSALQQHYLQAIQQFLGSASAAIAAPAISSSPTSNIAAGGSASAQTAELQQRLNSSVEAADVYVSAVLGCAAGSQGCSSVLHGSCTDAACQQQSSDSAEAVAATADGPWQTVCSKRQRQQYNQGAQQQQQQQQQFEGVSTLQRQVLLLLADCLGSADASVESSGSTGSDTGVPLLQCTDDLLAGHALWLKLLYGLCIAVQQDTGLVAPNPISRSSSCVPWEHLRSTGVSHPVVCHIVSFVCSLTDQLQSGDIQISQLQKLQLRSEPLLQLTAAVHAMQVAAPAGHVAASNSSCNVAAVSAALAAAEAALQQHTHQQQLLESFYSLLCPLLGATADLDPHVADLSSIEVRLQQSHIRDLNSEAVWGMHWGKLPAAAQVEGLLGLTVFHNSVKQFAADMAVDMELSSWSPCSLLSAWLRRHCWQQCSRWLRCSSQRCSLLLLLKVWRKGWASCLASWGCCSSWVGVWACRSS
jgi:hypothetical protein